MEHEEYARIAVAEDDHWWYRNTRALVAEVLEPFLRPGLMVLDAGCGPGGNGAWLQKYGTVVGVDVASAALDYVVARRPEVHPVRASVTRLPFPRETFDVVIALTVLYSVADDAFGVAELARVTKPGGVVVLFEPALRMLTREHDRTVHGLRRYQIRELANHAEQAGLRVHRATYAYSFLVLPAACLSLADRARRLRSRAASGSDVQRRSLDPVLGALARAERWFLRRLSAPFGLSALVVAVKEPRPRTQPDPAEGRRVAPTTAQDPRAT